MSPIKSLIQQKAEYFGVDITSTTRLPSSNVWRDISRIQAAADIRIALDVGAHVGETALALAHAFPSAIVYSFEPAQDAFGELRANVVDHPNIHPVHAAISDRRGEVALHRSTLDVCHSLRESPDADAGLAELVTALTVDEFCETHKIAAVDLLKSDTEGWDLNVLRGAEGLLRDQRVGFVLSEVTFDPNDAHHTSFTSVYELLTRYRYSFLALYDVVWHRVSPWRLNYANALFTAR